MLNWSRGGGDDERVTGLVGFDDEWIVTAS